MKERYQLNERLKRLEPTSTLCQYCNKGNSNRMEENYFVPIFKEQDRTNLIVYRSVKFNKLQIGIPRCKSCQSIHNTCLTYGWLIALIIVPLVIFSVFQFFGFGVFQLVFSIFFMAFGIVMGPPFIADLLAFKKGILSKKEGAKQEPLVQGMLHGGWTLTHPSA